MDYKPDQSKPKKESALDKMLNEIPTVSCEQMMADMFKPKEKPPTESNPRPLAANP